MITHKGTQTIHTDRLILRKFTVDDAQAMFENWASDERVTRYLTWCPHESPEATRQLLELWCAAYENPSAYNWVMEYEGTPIGNISVVRLSEKCEYAELGYYRPNCSPSFLPHLYTTDSQLIPTELNGSHL